MALPQQYQPALCDEDIPPRRRILGRGPKGATGIGRRRIAAVLESRPRVDT